MMQLKQTTNRLAIAAALWVAKEVGVRKSKQERKNSHSGKETDIEWNERVQLKVILPTWEGISTDQKGKDDEKLEEKEGERLRN